MGEGMKRDWVESYEGEDGDVGVGAVGGVGMEVPVMRIWSAVVDEAEVAEALGVPG